MLRAAARHHTVLLPCTHPADSTHKLGPRELRYTARTAVHNWSTTIGPDHRILSRSPWVTCYSGLKWWGNDNGRDVSACDLSVVKGYDCFATLMPQPSGMSWVRHTRSSVGVRIRSIEGACNPWNRTKRMSMHSSASACSTGKHVHQTLTVFCAAAPGPPCLVVLPTQILHTAKTRLTSVILSANPSAFRS